MNATIPENFNDSSRSLSNINDENMSIREQGTQSLSSDGSKHSFNNPKLLSKKIQKAKKTGSPENTNFCPKCCCQTSNLDIQNEIENSQYVKTLKKGLSESIDENDILRNRVIQLEALLSAAQDEIENRDAAILEIVEVFEQQKGNQIEVGKKELP